ncbi:MAG: hypothetical protein AAB492_03700 [Patescibacteria group bacterium]
MIDTASPSSYTESPIPQKKSDRIVPILMLILIGISSVLGYFLYTSVYPPSTAVILRKSQTIQSADTTVNNAPDVDAPTPTPDKGSGNYVCDPLGFCNLADDKGKAGCPVTFADPKCLNICDDVSKRCK